MENNNRVVVFDSTKPTTCQNIIDIIDIIEKLDSTIRVHELTSGDVLYISNTGKEVKLGDEFMNYPAIVLEIHYEPKKWWQFWKPKKQIGYSVKLI